MTRKTLLLAAVLLVTGCKDTTGTQTGPRTPKAEVAQDSVHRGPGLMGGGG